MNWASAAEFFAMGGYAFYVWGSFLATAVCITAELLLLRTRRSEALRRVRAEKVRHEATA
ncbi:MAG TPA: heme exporter protein CcmD [Burkholderiales bacterium]|jgi:heme exporter protein D|nr:heme exporter protein CcmD [Burkholderiales bacterium]